MDEKTRRLRIIEDREKRAASVLGIDHDGQSSRVKIQDELVNLLVDALHLADHKQQGVDLEEVIKQARALHEQEKLSRPPSSGGMANVPGWA